MFFHSFNICHKHKCGKKEKNIPKIYMGTVSWNFMGNPDGNVTTSAKKSIQGTDTTFNISGIDSNLTTVKCIGSQQSY